MKSNVAELIKVFIMTGLFAGCASSKNTHRSIASDSAGENGYCLETAYNTAKQKLDEQARKYGFDSSFLNPEPSLYAATVDENQNAIVIYKFVGGIYRGNYTSVVWAKKQTCEITSITTSDLSVLENK